MRIFTILTALCLMLNTVSVTAQDPNFSQFFVSPLTLNPALTGKFNGTFRVAGNYRDQWPAISNAFITSTASFDLPILTGRISELDTWGVGVMAMTDRTANGILTTNSIAVTTAYHKGLDEDGLHQIGIGFQGTYTNKRLDGTKLNFQNELDDFGGWTNPSGESVDEQVLNVKYFDFSLGALYNGSTDGYNNFYLGVSAYHVNKPQETFTGIYYTLNPRLTVHAGGAIPLGDRSKTVYLSSLFSRQAAANNIVLGGAVGFNVNGDEENPTNFYAGLWTRFNNVNDAVIPYVGLEFGGFRLGASYDVNISSLKTASQSRGGIEISLIYINRPPGNKGIPCPRF
ncbi:PorP/SprF family type IX secretion system membrane protein [Paraflavitalea sp. CAU 1676]|uniref:PorP/SprF family type IX secretion system membrane protein n=1 Tax=Paraflavitalea sp. CAU 1676 TaxID=3032598 RepID=UPI0023DAF95F|nr:PorP/SprF family type IX secretion system membrane protein [Paraflavitalea sp. CAU 1676]MDF2193050.1 PorP/SprF family type IX secretion system membrane protein [Paraflavitalea sp. CAU 1676]